MVNQVQSAPSEHAPPGQTVHLIHHSFRPGGGMERYAVDLATGFLDAGWPVTVHACRVDDQLAESARVQVHRLELPRFPRKLLDYRFFRAIERWRARNAPGLRISLARVRSGGLMVCGGTHRGFLAATRKWAGPFDWLQIWMETQAYRSAQQVVAHSRLCQRELTGYYHVPAEKIITLFPPVGAAFSVPTEEDRQAHRARLGFPKDKVVFLFPSTGHRRKGFAPVCQAVAEFADQAILAVAGKSPGSNCPDFVRYLGYVREMQPVYGAADFTILGSFYEPFGLVGIESVLCGTRLVFEEKMGCLEALRPGSVATFSVRQPDTLRQALASAMELARHGQHRLSRPREALLYDPSIAEHVRQLLQAVERFKPIDLANPLP